MDAFVEYLNVKTADGGLWLHVKVDGELAAIYGPFTTKGERKRFSDDLLKTMRSAGAKDHPNLAQ